VCHTIQNIIRVIESRRLSWTGYVASTGEMRNAYKIFIEKMKGRDNSEDLAVNWKVILE